MVTGLIVVALAMVVAGLVAIVSGSDGIGLESGWALVIAGSVASTGGVLVLALAFILRELRTLPDRLETAHTDETGDTAQSPFEKLAPVEAPDRPPIPQVVQGPGFARPVKPVGDQAPPVFAGHVRTADERAATASRSGFPFRDPGPHGDAGSQRLPSAASNEELPAAEPVDKAPPVFPDFSPRALLEASRAKRKGRGKPVDPDLTQPQERGAVEPTVVIPSDAVRGEGRHDQSEHEPDAIAKSAAADDLEKALLA